MKRSISARAAAAASLLGAAAALAQQPPAPAVPPTVSVDLTKVSKTIADRLGVDESNMPLSMQLTPQQAAEVCEAGRGTPPAAAGSCTASTSSASLDRMIMARMKTDE